MLIDVVACAMIVVRPDSCGLCIVCCCCLTLLLFVQWLLLIDVAIVQCLLSLVDVVVVFAIFVFVDRFMLSLFAQCLLCNVCCCLCNGVLVF